MGKSTDSDLVISNAQTNEEYRDESYQIPKNTSLIVRRVPITNAPKSGGHGGMPSGNNMTPVISKPVALTPAPLVAKDSSGMPDDELANDENAKINALLSTHAGLGADRPHMREHRPHNSFPTDGRIVAPPPTYICHRCNQPGHYINQCPTNGDPNFNHHKSKKASGIPKIFLKPVQNPGSAAGSSTVLMPGGGVAVVLTHESEFAKLAKSIISSEVPGEEDNQGESVSGTSSAKGPAPAFPSTCSQCKNQVDLTSYFVSPCCNKQFCFQCIKEYIKKVTDGDVAKKPLCPDCFTTMDVDQSRMEEYELKYRPVEKKRPAPEQEESATTTTNDDNQSSKKHRTDNDTRVDIYNKQAPQQLTTLDMLVNTTTLPPSLPHLNHNRTQTSSRPKTIEVAVAEGGVQSALAVTAVITETSTVTIVTIATIVIIGTAKTIETTETGIPLQWRAVTTETTETTETETVDRMIARERP
ncbi:hypothetical protein SAMD00019534_063940 [Acytostelium subglobosum LB1]|uniref:hypothetical protein n=1 Tax=Acytostelium subglobosum LB1 TaxID=1410327 RepID=UPI000645231E|nr:hypothetical protein SAMD00019534_063940 [Acytostelium subglobosum LB1]GAM23219.1 hypothetical protein SAMD00019534_063940 [Acytostelium subglobosum LB1]|eukprot:XP_012753668.1 hypothetical protein SAMD00019534_063940 [Acytostelium subglobosum LB1]